MEGTWLVSISKKGPELHRPGLDVDTNTCYWTPNGLDTLRLPNARWCLMMLVEWYKVTWQRAFYAQQFGITAAEFKFWKGHEFTF